MWISEENLELQVSSPNLKKPKKAEVIVAQIMIESECVVEEIAKRAWKSCRWMMVIGRRTLE